MPKSGRKIVIIGDQQPEIDVTSLARVIVRYARHARRGEVPASRPGPNRRPIRKDRA